MLGHPGDKSSSSGVWISSEEASKCVLCIRNFTKFRRKHHCRTCGQVVCGSCASKHKGFGWICSLCVTRQTGSALGSHRQSGAKHPNNYHSPDRGTRAHLAQHTAPVIHRRHSTGGHLPQDVASLRALEQQQVEAATRLSLRDPSSPSSASSTSATAAVVHDSSLLSYAATQHSLHPAPRGGGDGGGGGGGDSALQAALRESVATSRREEERKSYAQRGEDAALAAAIRVSLASSHGQQQQQQQQRQQQRHGGGETMQWDAEAAAAIAAACGAGSSSPHHPAIGAFAAAGGGGGGNMGVAYQLQGHQGSVSYGGGGEGSELLWVDSRDSSAAPPPTPPPPPSRRLSAPPPRAQQQQWGARDELPPAHPMERPFLAAQELATAIAVAPQTALPAALPTATTTATTAAAAAAVPTTGAGATAATAVPRKVAKQGKAAAAAAASASPAGRKKRQRGRSSGSGKSGAALLYGSGQPLTATAAAAAVPSKRGAAAAAAGGGGGRSQPLPLALRKRSGGAQHGDAIVADSSSDSDSSDSSSSSSGSSSACQYDSSSSDSSDGGDSGGSGDDPHLSALANKLAAMATAPGSVQQQQSVTAAAAGAAASAAAAATTFDCIICLEETAVEAGCTLTCDHRFCFPCMRAFVRDKVAKAQVSEAVLHCPHPGCSQPVTAHEVRGCVAPTVYARFLEHRLRACADLPLVECRCGNVMEVPPQRAQVQCSHCRHRFCRHCAEPPHAELSCVEARAARFATADGAAVGEQAARQLVAQQGGRSCPRCGVLHAGKESAQACDHVACVCGHQFCFACDADRGPILAHGNHYHMKHCPHFTQCCAMACVTRHSGHSCELENASPSCDACSLYGALCPLPLPS